jgi:hypothetical protein
MPFEVCEVGYCVGGWGLQQRGQLDPGSANHVPLLCFRSSVASSGQELKSLLMLVVGKL